MATIPKSAWIKLYKDLQRAAAKFPQYSYREFFKRRIREQFAAAVKDENLSPEDFYKKEQELLTVICRQVIIIRSFPTTKLVIEGIKIKQID